MRTPSKRIDYSDLIGLPYEPGGATAKGCDCVGVGSLALKRMNAPLHPGDLPLSETDLQASLHELAGGSEESPWEQVGLATGDATRLGDIVLSETPDGSHIAVLVDEARRIALTACAPLYREQEDPDGELDQDGLRPLHTVLVREGQTFACPVRRIRGCLGVYRLRRWAGVR